MRQNGHKDRVKGVTRMEAATIVGILTTGTILHTMIKYVSKQDIDTCVSAYYADKFNGERAGVPSKTFLKCMKAQYPDTFKEIYTRYSKPQAPSNTS